MPFDLARLISSCERGILKKLCAVRSSNELSDELWALPPRALGDRLEAAYSGDSNIWPLLNHVEALAKSSPKSLIQSVIYRDRDLRNEFDDLDVSDETAAAWLALSDAAYFDFALSALHADRGLNKRSWRAYRVRFDEGVQFEYGPEAQARYESLVREAITKARTFDTPGRLVIEKFDRVVFPESSLSRRDQVQVTVHAEARNVTDGIITETNERQTRTLKKLEEISVLFVPGRRELDVVTIGGKSFVRAIALAFCKSFASHPIDIEDLVRRPVHLQLLARRPRFGLDHQDLVTSWAVDEIRVRSATGWLLALGCKTRGTLREDVYDVAEREFGDRSPFTVTGWSVESARLRFDLEPSKVGHRGRIRTVELRPDGKTNLREQEDNDRFIANELLVRWGLLDPEGPDEP